MAKTLCSDRNTEKDNINDLCLQVRQSKLSLLPVLSMAQVSEENEAVQPDSFGFRPRV